MNLYKHYIDLSKEAIAIYFFWQTKWLSTLFFRGENKPACYLFETVEDNAEQCMFTCILNTDLKVSRTVNYHKLSWLWFTKFQILSFFWLIYDRLHTNVGQLFLKHPKTFCNEKHFFKIFHQFWSGRFRISRKCFLIIVSEHMTVNTITSL